MATKAKTTKKKDEVDDFFNVSTGPETQKVKVYMVQKTEDVPGAITESKGRPDIKYPYYIKIINEDGELVSEDSSTGSTYAMDWNKKFYLRNVDGKQYVGYYRHAVVLALYTLMEAMELAPVDNLQDLVGFEFDAVIRGTKPGFISWVETFKANDVPVPSITDLGGKEEVQKEVVDNTETKIDPDELPF